MKRLALIVITLACEEPTASVKAKPDFHFVEDSECGPAWSNCSVLHDDKRNVTCWAMWQSNGNSMTCYPDWELTKPQMGE